MVNQHHNNLLMIAVSIVLLIVSRKNCDAFSPRTTLSSWMKSAPLQYSDGVLAGDSFMALDIFPIIPAPIPQTPSSLQPKTAAAAEPTITRLYTDDDGFSRLETRSMTPRMHPMVDDEGARSHATVAQDCDFVSFRIFPVGYDHSWHCAPRRQYVVVLQGQIEITLRDHHSETFGPGGILLAEDMTGSGHCTRVVGETPVLYCLIPLVDKYDENDNMETVGGEGLPSQTVLPRLSVSTRPRSFRRGLVRLASRVPGPWGTKPGHRR